MGMHLLRTSRLFSAVHGNIGARLGLLTTILLSSSCSPEAAVAPMAGAFPLRAIHVNGTLTVTVPASVATYGTDTVRYASGSFEIGPENEWREQWQRVTVSGGVESQPQVFESHGVYRITKGPAGATLLDLYPGQIIPANIMPTAVLRSDTLSHGAFIFVR